MKKIRRAKQQQCMLSAVVTITCNVERTPALLTALKKIVKKSYSAVGGSLLWKSCVILSFSRDN
jgi:hemoglobin-like flavoprotein